MIEQRIADSLETIVPTAFLAVVGVWVVLADGLLPRIWQDLSSLGQAQRTFNISYVASVAVGPYIFTRVRKRVLRAFLSENAKHKSELVHSEKRFSKLVDQVQEYAVFWISHEGLVETWNAGAERIKGYRAEEIVGRPIEVFYLAEDNQAGRPADLLRRADLTGQSLDEGWRVRKGRSRFWAEVTISAIRNASGELQGYSKLTHDITARHRLEQDLRQKSEALEWAHVLIRDLDGRVIVWNKGAEQLYGWTQVQALGRVSHDLLQTHFPVSRAVYDETLRQQGWWEGELRHHRADGEELVTLINQVIHRDPLGTPIAILEVNTDITGLKRTQTTLREAFRNLEELSRQLVEAQEGERRHVARELHDQLGQLLTAAKVTVGIIPRLPPAAMAQKVSDVEFILDDLLALTRQLSLSLRPPMLDDLELIPALTWHIQRFQVQTGLDVRFGHLGLETERFSAHLETTVFRLIQEALTNIA